MFTLSRFNIHFKYSGFDVDKFLVYTGFGVDKFLVYSGFGIDKFLVYSGFGIDKFLVYLGFRIDMFYSIIVISTRISSIAFYCTEHHPLNWKIFNTS